MGKSEKNSRQHDLFEDQNFPMLDNFELPTKIGIVCQRMPDGRLATNVPHRITVHSPTGFECGYAGSGPADFALNALMCFLEKDSAMRLHQEFKSEFIATMDSKGGSVTLDKISAFISRHTVPLGEYQVRKVGDILIHEGNV